MKKLILLGGTMGVGKTAVCRLLSQQLAPSVWLDGDWCWMMNPFVVNDENKAMVMGNIHALLRSFLQNSSLEYILFCWVLHEQSIWDDVLQGLPLEDAQVVEIALTCSPEALRQHFEADGRDLARVEASQARLPLYGRLRARQVDTTDLTLEQAAQRVRELIQNPGL